MSKAYSYLRFSTPEQLKGDSLRRQYGLALDYCRQNGLELDTDLTYQDLGVSAFRGRNASTGRLGDFLEAVEVGLIPKGSYLLVESLDRVSRQAARRALKVLESICEAGITVVTLVDGRQYTEESLDTDPMALIMSVLVFIRANEESTMKSNRLSASWEGKREQLKDKPMTSVGPHWLRLDKESGTWEVLEDRAAIIRRMFQLAGDGRGAGAICNQLTKEGLKPPKGGNWHPGAVTRLLKERTVIGTFTPHIRNHSGEGPHRIAQEPIEGYYPSIIDMDLWDRVQAVRRTQKKGRGGAYNIFGSMSVCVLCGGPMTMLQARSRKGTKLLRVTCWRARNGVGCVYLSFSYNVLEDSFLRDIEGILSLTPGGREEGLEEELERLEATILELQVHHKAAVDGWVKTQDTSLLARMNSIKAEIETFQMQRDGLLQQMVDQSGPVVSKRVGELRGALREEPMDRPKVNGLMRALFTGMAIDPRTGQAVLNWRHGGQSSFQFYVPSKRPPRRGKKAS